MPIVRADIETPYNSQFQNDTGANGGRMTANALGSAVIGNVFPSAAEAERLAGSQKFRKFYFKDSEGTTPEGLALQNSKVYVENFSPGTDDVLFWPGTQSDVQSAYTPLDVNDKPINVPNGGQVYAGGQLNADMLAGATTLDVLMHEPDSGNFIYFADGMEIRISDRANVDDTGNSEVFVTIAAGGVTGPVAGVWSLTVTSPVGPAFAAVSTRVAGVYAHGTVGGSQDNEVVTSASGTLDLVGFPFQFDNQGSIEDGWTITFTSATDFGCVGTVTGSVGTGTIGSDFAPTNSDFGRPYFTLPSGAWGGTWVLGDTVTWDTHPASIPLWVFRDIKAGTASVSSNKTILVFEGESP